MAKGKVNKSAADDPVTLRSLEAFISDALADRRKRPMVNHVRLFMIGFAQLLKLEISAADEAAIASPDENDPVSVSTPEV